MKPIRIYRYQKNKKPRNQDLFFGKEPGGSLESLWAPTSSPFFSSAQIHRKEACCGQEGEGGQNKEEVESTIHRSAEGRPQAKVPAQGVGNPPLPHTRKHLQSLSRGGQPIPVPWRPYMEAKMGVNLSHVRIHQGIESDRSAREVQALAYTYGRHIVFRDGYFQPETPDGQRLLAHELAHVFQDKGPVLQRKPDKEGEDEKRKKKPPVEADSQDYMEGGEEDCGPDLNLEAITHGDFSMSSYSMIQEKKKKNPECEDCDDGCLEVQGKMKMTFSVKTEILMPSIPSGLRPCQQLRVKKALREKILPHEKQHQKIMQGFRGTVVIPVYYSGCEGEYKDHLDALAKKTFDKRKTEIMDKSDSLDPFSVKVDLCCQDKPRKKKP